MESALGWRLGAGPSTRTVRQVVLPRGSSAFGHLVLYSTWLRSIAARRASALRGVPPDAATVWASPRPQTPPVSPSSPPWCRHTSRAPRLPEAPEGRPCLTTVPGRCDRPGRPQDTGSGSGRKPLRVAEATLPGGCVTGAVLGGARSGTARPGDSGEVSQHPRGNVAPGDDFGEVSRHPRSNVAPGDDSGEVSRHPRGNVAPGDDSGEVSRHPRSNVAPGDDSGEVSRHPRGNVAPGDDSGEVSRHPRSNVAPGDAGFGRQRRGAAARRQGTARRGVRPGLPPGRSRPRPRRAARPGVGRRHGRPGRRRPRKGGRAGPTSRATATATGQATAVGRRPERGRGRLRPAARPDGGLHLGGGASRASAPEPGCRSTRDVGWRPGLGQSGAAGCGVLVEHANQLVLRLSQSHPWAEVIGRARQALLALRRASRAGPVRAC